MNNTTRSHSSSSISRPSATDLFSMRSPIVINVINGQKQWFSFTTTGTFTTIYPKNGGLIFRPNSCGSLAFYFSCVHILL